MVCGPGIKSGPSAVKGQSPNYWTVRECVEKKALSSFGHQKEKTLNL